MATDTASAAPSATRMVEKLLRAIRTHQASEFNSDHPCLEATAKEAEAWLSSSRAQPTPSAVSSAIKALVTAALLEGGVSLERTAQARAETEAREAELIALIGAAPPAVVHPLTDEQIEREWQFLHDEEGNHPDHSDFARAIEAAHGIGIKKGDSHA